MSGRPTRGGRATAARPPAPRPHAGAAFALAGLLLAIAAQPARAQPVVAWEFLGNPALPNGEIYSLAFKHGPAADGSLDTLFAGAFTNGTFRLAPGGTWSGNLNPGSQRNTYLAITPAGTILAGLDPLWRSTDGGRTWALVRDHMAIEAMFQPTAPGLDGYVFVGTTVNVYRSAADGVAGSWEGSAETGFSASLGEVRSGAALPGGRVLLGTYSGVAYSDDGGATWTPSSLWSGFHVTKDLAFHPVEGHPYGGVAWAGVSYDFSPSVWRSDDGGATWAEVRHFADGAFGVPDPNDAAVDVGPDGAVWVGLKDAVAGAGPDLGVVVRSVDGGLTWVAVTEGWGGRGVYVLAWGRDGRLYAGTDRGVYRTAGPVTAAEPGAPAPERPGLGVRVEPNPAGASAEVVLTVRGAGAVVVTVLDASGREVRRPFAGWLGAGEHRVGVETGALAPGVYVVRAEAGGVAATARLTVAR